MSSLSISPGAATISIPASSSTRRQRNPPNDAALLAANFRLLKGRQWWPVIADSDPRSLTVAGDPDFERCRLAEATGYYDEFARILIAHAVVASVRHLSHRRISKWIAQSPTGCTPEELQELLEGRIRQNIHRDIARRIEAGGSAALIALNSVDPKARVAPMIAAAEEMGLLDDRAIRNAAELAASSTSANGSGIRPAGPFDDAPPSAQALRRARKCLASSSMDWEVMVQSVEPLSLGIYAGQKHGGRFLAHLAGISASDERDRANTLVARCLVALVEHADESALIGVAPDVKIAGLTDTEYARDVLCLYRASMMERLDTAIDRSGYDGLVGLMSASPTVRP